MMMMAAAMMMIIIILPQSPMIIIIIPNHLVPIRATLRGRPSTLCPIVWIFTRLGYRAAMLGTIWMRDGLNQHIFKDQVQLDYNCCDGF